MSNNPARTSQLQSSEQGACPLCKDINSKQAINCMNCGARLPWADEATAQRNSALNVSGASATSTPPQSLPLASAHRPVGNSHFYAAPGSEEKRSPIERFADVIMPVSGLIVVGALIYFIWFRATGGMAGKGLTLIPIGLIGRFIVNKLFDD